MKNYLTFSDEQFSSIMGHGGPKAPVVIDHQG
jgi:hypothetical protein